MESSTVSEVIDRAVQQLGYTATKEHQRTVVEGLVGGKDVFGILPTGYGKSLCYACLPLVFDQLEAEAVRVPAIVLVVTPLTAIMDDQMASLSTRGLKVCCINGQLQDDAVKARVLEGQYQLVIFTPEMLLNNGMWRRMLTNDIYSKRLHAFVVDEAHTVKKWGESFRKVLLRLNEVRSLLPVNTKMLALTATATIKLRLDVQRILGMVDPVIISLSPCKANIKFSIIPYGDTFLLNIVEQLRLQKSTYPRTVIYCRRFSDCADIYELFRDELGRDFTNPPNQPDVPMSRRVDMFLSCTDPVVKTAITTRFTEVSDLRIVIATMAFGMGIDSPDVQQVIHYGPPCDIETYVQETG